jgi:hypothetical protein
MEPDDWSIRLLSLMRRHDNVASRLTLRNAGIPARAIDAAVAIGLISCLRRGYYAGAAADLDQRRAGILGGRLTCVSILRRQGIWAGHDPRLHVQLGRSASPEHRAAVSLLGRDPSERRTSGQFEADAGTARIHWSRPGTHTLLRPEGSTEWRESTLDSLRLAMTCMDEENALAAVDSALRLGRITHDDLDDLFEALPERLRALRALIDPRADSGQESIVRLRLIRAGFRVEPQVPVPGSSALDLLIEGLVGLEIDSREWHGDDEQIKFDFDKTLRSQESGTPCLRILYWHVFHDWPRTLRTIGRAVEDARFMLVGREFAGRRGRRAR